MPEYVMIMKGGGRGGNAVDWDRYIQVLSDSGLFRGGSAFGNGICVSQKDDESECVATGYMRFEAASIEQVRNLVPENPVYKSGGQVEIHELIVS